MTEKAKRRIAEDIYMAGTLLFGGRLALLACAAILRLLGAA